jgi:hypothetical protein
VTGYGNNGTTNQAFIGTTSGSTPVPLPSGWTISFGSAINNSGQVTGNGWIAGPNLAFVGTSSGSMALPLSPGCTNEVGYAINSLGQVALGCSSSGVGAPVFIASASGTVAIPPPSGSTFASVSAINDAGQVAGNLAPANSQAYLGTTAGSTAIPLPTGSTTASVGSGSLNNSGIVVGSSQAGAWIWDAANGTRLLNTLVPPLWNVTGAISISNNGLILAEAYDHGGPSQWVELIPAGPSSTPAPSTLALVMIGTALCCAWQAWSRRTRYS